MKIVFAVVLALASLCTASAQQVVRNKVTKVTLSEPTQVPGKVLAAGTYTFKLLDDNANRHIVQIFNEDQTQVIATVMALPNERLHPSEKTVMMYQERPVGEPVALEAWFYPGDTVGQQFAYPKAKAEELSRLNHVDVPSAGSEEASGGTGETSGKIAAATAPGQTSRTSGDTARTSAEASRGSENRAVTSENQTATRGRSNPAAPEPTYSAAAQPDVNPPQAARNRAAAPSTRAARQDTSRDASQNAAARLPNTASALPTIALLGVSLIGVAFLLKRMVRA
jgi:hypothetical protein